MKIIKLKLSPEHWSTDWIPVSYKNILSKQEYDKSVTFLWSENYIIKAICRCYYIQNSAISGEKLDRIEIGDIWLNENLRGTFLNVKGKKIKVSLLFMKNIVAKIWKLYPKINIISLVVSKDNIPAIKLYEKLNFKKVKNITVKELSIHNGLYMTRQKK